MSSTANPDKWFVYIVECADKSFYTGSTCDIERRIKEHNSKHAGKYTSIFGPVKLLWKESHPAQSLALKREAQIKRWTRKKKEALIRGDLRLLKKL